MNYDFIGFKKCKRLDLQLYDSSTHASYSADIWRGVKIVQALFCERN